MDEQPGAAVLEKILRVGGNLEELSAEEKAEYYGAVCRSLGLNPLTRPFEYLTLNGKLHLYALRDCADQLRRVHGISIYIASREVMVATGVYVVTARAKDRAGREDESTGAVHVAGLKGDALANAYMKAETKAKRRVTLSIAGLGWLDESEAEGIAAAVPVEPSTTAAAPPAAEPTNRAPAPAMAGPSWTLAQVDAMASVAVNTALAQRLRYLAPDSKEERNAYIRLGFGEAAGCWPEVDPLGLSVRKRGLLALLELRKDAPPAEAPAVDDDVPLGGEAGGDDPPPKATAGTAARGGRRVLSLMLPLPDGVMFDVAGPHAPLPWVGSNQVVTAEWLRVLHSRADALRTLAVWRTLKAKYPAMNAKQYADAWLVLGQQTAS